MVAVAQASPAEVRRLVVVRSTPASATRATPTRGTATPAARPPAIGGRLGSVPAATYRRRRLAAAVLLAGVVAALVLAVQLLVSPFVADPASAGAGAGRQAAVAGPVHVVQPGDTFWGIARALRPNDDPRPLVDRLVADHGSPVLVVGERIALPAGG
jgi:nucleoid-associated protein YgaU